jgi:TetR/AcrR family transcriptional repressor of mexJK operon
MEQLIDAPAAVDESPKRRQIVAAAHQLFLAHGYGAVSMDAVARTAGVSKATLYAYFASKDELFATIVNERRLQKGLDDLMVPERVPDLRAALETIGQHVLRFMLREETLAIYRIAIAESARFPELGHAFYANGPQRSYETARAWLATQQAAGLVRPADLDVATQQFMSLLRSGVFLRAGLALPPPPSEAEINATVSAAVETWLRAFAVEGEQRAGGGTPSPA